jgi:hypothetical protein
MKLSFNMIIIFFISLILLNSSLFAKEIILDDLQNGLSPKWKEKSFKGFTRYSVTKKDDRWCIKAESDASASGLYYEIDYNPVEYPIINWSWKIDHIISKGDAKTKQGDDYAARVYVVFHSFFFWKTRAINYIWANKLPRGEFIPNSYTSNAIMIAVQSGSENAGKWILERRNVVEDYRAGFGGDPPKIGAIAIMTDTDNTGEKAKACYGPIRILSLP